MVGMEWGMDHLAWRGPKYKYRCKNVIETQCLLSPMHACKYRINLARNMLCVMWQIQMEALKEINKSKKKLTQYPSDHQTERRCPDICWPRMIDIQHKVANQDGLYEVVVNGEGDGDLRVISVSRTIFSTTHCNAFLTTSKCQKIRGGARRSLFLSSSSTTSGGGGEGGTRWRRCLSGARTPSTHSVVWANIYWT